MEDEERQKLLDENASLRAEVAQLKQTIDALVRKRSTEHLLHFCQSSGGYGIYATRLSMV